MSNEGGSKRDGKTRRRKRSRDEEAKPFHGGGRRQPAKRRSVGSGAPRTNEKTTSSGQKQKSMDLFEKMKSRLSGGRFRWLNEQLYTSSGEESFQKLSREPELYEQYHEGFREQTRTWPQQPVDIAVRWLGKKKGDLIVADFGCGDAKLERSVKQKVHSIDLVATAPNVIACNMASTPLQSASVDVAVFCLALMGTDYGLFLQEANRVLRAPGYLWIAEVRSRFGDSFEEKFLANLNRLGFTLRSKDVTNKMFAIYVLEKLRNVSSIKDMEWPTLKPCIYKRR